MTTAAETNTDRLDAAKALLAERHPRMGTYGWSVLSSHRDVSGADLTGKARSYGASYARSRKIVAEAVRDAGGHIRCRLPDRKLVICWDDVPEGAKHNTCSVGDCWIY